MDHEPQPGTVCTSCDGPMVWSKVSFRPPRLHPDRVGRPVWVGSEACCRNALRDPTHPCRPARDAALREQVASSVR